MPHFYFHVHNDVEAIDPEGRELPDLDAAREAATRDAREMAAEMVMQGRLHLGHCIEVTDGKGAPVMTVTFGDVIEIKR